MQRYPSHYTRLPPRSKGEDGGVGNRVDVHFESGRVLVYEKKSYEESRTVNCHVQPDTVLTIRVRCVGVNASRQCLKLSLHAGFMASFA